MRRIILAILLALPAAASGPTEVVCQYQLRGGVRLLLFWVGRDNVGGGRISVTRNSDPAATRWREEIEVLFGSDPERIPNKINRWGYGRESSEWTREAANSAPRLLSTEFQGIMRHSAESSMQEAVKATKQAADTSQYIYDVIRSIVLPAEASSEIRIMSEQTDFDYRRPERLLSKYRESLATSPPVRRSQLLNTPAEYGAPYGFLTGLAELIRQVTETGSRRPLTCVYHSKRYVLEVLSVQPVRASQMRPQWSMTAASEVSRIQFRCFNTVKKTRTDFELWIPRTGALKGIPLRILLQPRWWLRLQMDLDAVSNLPGGG